MRSDWSGMLWIDGELLRAYITYDGGSPTLWTSDSLRDDINDIEDLGESMFFTDEDHFARWLIEPGNVAPITPEEVWNV